MYGIALDLGTSGFRAQVIDLETKETLKTVITMGHPLPGGNVMDHLDFAIKRPLLMISRGGIPVSKASLVNCSIPDKF